MKSKIIEILFSPAYPTTEARLLAIETAIVVNLMKINASGIHNDLSELKAGNNLILEFEKQYDND